MGCGSIGDIDNVAGSNSVAVPCRGKKSRRDGYLLTHIVPDSIRRGG